MAPDNHLPPCCDFLVAATRRIRKVRRNLKGRTKAGTGLYKVYAAAKEVYPDQEIRDALNVLLNDGTIVISVEYYESTRGKTAMDVEIGPRRMELIERISPDMTLEKYVTLDDGWRRVDKRSVPSYRFLYSTIKIHIVADGLSQKPAEMLRKKRFHQDHRDSRSPLVREIISDARKKKKN